MRMSSMGFPRRLWELRPPGPSAHVETPKTRSSRRWSRSTSSIASILVVTSARSGPGFPWPRRTIGGDGRDVGIDHPHVFREDEWRRIRSFTVSQKNLRNPKTRCANGQWCVRTSAQAPKLRHARHGLAGIGLTCDARLSRRARFWRIPNYYLVLSVTHRLGANCPLQGKRRFPQLRSYVMDKRFMRSFGAMRSLSSVRDRRDFGRQNDEVIRLLATSLGVATR